MAKKKLDYTLLTFYKFVDIADPHAEVADHQKFCQDIWLKGRIYIWEEWISATLTGNDWQIKAYRLYLSASRYFSDISDIDEKATRVDKHYFDKMFVRYRKEIVALWTTVTQWEIEKYRKELSPDDFKKLIDSGDLEDRVIVDMRNDYEYKLWHFKNAVPAWTINFREVPDLLEKYKETFGNKKILWYCTGWIRCEKLSAIVHKAWMENVYGLEWWVVKYVNTYNDWNWLGNLYTFDGRISTHVGDEHTHTTIGRCIYTDTPSDICENCRYSPCNARIIVDQKEFKKHMWFCSQDCFQKAKETILIKDMSRDWYEYSKMRSAIKVKPELFATYQKNTEKHLNDWVWEITFNHETSQKETIVFQD